MNGETDGTATSPNDAPKQGLLLTFFSHPITGFVGVTASVVAIPLAFYFYYGAEKNPKLVLQSHPVRTAIVQANRVSDLSVSFRGKSVTNDVSAVQLVIWNAGKSPIRHEDILQSVTIVSGPNCPILEASIRHTTRPITGFNLITNEIAQGRITFDWKILEHNDGASIQILYAGPPQKLFENEGAVIGQNTIPFYFAANRNTGLQSLSLSGFGAFMLVYTGLFLRSVIKAFKKARITGRKIPLAFHLILFGFVTLTSHSRLNQGQKPGVSSKTEGSVREAR